MAPIQIAAQWTEGRQCPLGLDARSPRFSWSFGASPKHARKQTAYRIVVGTTENGSDAWDSGVIRSAAHTSIKYEGAALQPRQRYYWRVTVWDEAGEPAESPTAWWETGQLSESGWTGRWIGEPEAHAEEQGMPQFRREFRLSGPFRRARAYISGLGHYELRLNGSRVGEYELDPGWTNYDKTVQYTVYDVTSLLQQGENAVGISLGNGFFHVPGGRYTKFKDSFGHPRCRMDLVVEHEDGRTETIGTDGSWTVSASPLTFSCIYGGEDYDARLEQAGWDQPGYAEDARWSPAAEVEAPEGRLLAQPAPPLKVMRRFALTGVTQPKPGTYVLDLGQNFSGWPEISVSGPAGAQIKLIPAEILTEDGLANQKWSGAPYELNYTLKGDGVEVWRPRFTYYGFRYVQLEGAAPVGQAGAGAVSGLPVLHAIIGQMIYPDTPVVGGFRSSDEMLNRIHEVIDWAILSNMKSVFTDCPHREKLGWLEQVHLLGPSILFNYDVEALFGKVLDDIADAQTEDGLVPTTAPEYVVFKEPWQMFRDATAWGGTYVLTAWEVLQRYGSGALLERHYDGMKRYIDYLTSSADGLIIRGGLGDWYDIGPEGPGFAQNTPVPLAETAIYYGLTVVMGRIASLLGHSDEADVFASLAASIKEAFNGEYFDSGKRMYAEGSDAALAMPLAIGLAPEEHRAHLLESLVRNIAGRDYQTTAGDIGHRYVLLALSRAGRSDVIYRMTRTTDKPGYGYMIANGATTLTEAWDGPTVGKSQNHFMLGHIEEWLYSSLAGLDYRFRPEAGRMEVIVKPDMANDLAWAEAWYDLRAGRASVRWERGEGGSITLAAEIPVNADGLIYVPAEAADKVRGGGTSSELLRFKDGYAVYRTGSGSYTFTSRLQESMTR
ncbi:family 78 glycoside hydrolase catalytic domain [Paenibacillus aurantius]|uniref:alpha-L-rhamnosidase n=1 Tax=Paenibacillus aurantius TaxID=2918900 RepID=A0AA96LGF0_9BACL|nr:family 78 glycoside hydrolase catalytic domain [Paenibacillus aurantius]WNQ13584.1 family 78 glycoside hydrolase catalytic domain [Paenibacillus aurantius]